MKKIIIFIISIIAYHVTAYSQELKPVKIDSMVTVNLPADYQVKDTLGQKIFSANASLGYMVIIRSANAANNQPLKKEKDLNKVFKEYVKKVQAQSNGSVLNQRDTTIGNLKAKVFALETNEGEGIQLRDFAVIYTQDATYTFEYLYPESRKELVQAENKAFFTSIKTSNDLQRTDQYINTASGSVSSTGKIAIYGGGAIILIMIGYFIFRRKTETVIS